MINTLIWVMIILLAAFAFVMALLLRLEGEEDRREDKELGESRDEDEENDL